MAEEEFQESEVIFSDDNEDESFHEIFHVSSNKHGRRFMNSDSSNKSNNGSNYKKKKKMVNNSVPVNIPVDADFRFPDEEDDDDLMIAGVREIVPPHLVVGRRLAGGNMAYSVRTGTGRTLKGRDLSQVRNSILRLTGFLET